MALTGSFAPRPAATTCGHPHAGLYNAAANAWSCRPCAEATEAASPFRICPNCSGETHDGAGRCAECNGTGQVLKPGARTFTVTLTETEVAALVGFAHHLGPLEPIYPRLVDMADEVAPRRAGQ